MAPENKSKNNKRKNYLPHNKPVKKGAWPLRPGVEGFFITCDGGREYQASQEAIDVIDSFYDELVEGIESKDEQAELPKKPLNKIIKFADSDSSDNESDDAADEATNNDHEKDENDVQTGEEKDKIVLATGADGSDESAPEIKDNNAQLKNGENDESAPEIKDNQAQQKNDDEPATEIKDNQAQEKNEKPENDDKKEAEAAEPPAKRQCVEADAPGKKLPIKVEQKSVDKLIEDELKELGDKSQMVGGNFCTRRYYFRKCKRVRWSPRKCKRVRWSPAESIPDELWFEIMLRLQAKDIYFRARLVCRKWYHMTRTQYFIHTHLEHATYGLLYVENMPEDVIFISLRKDGRGIDKYKLNYKIPRYVCGSSCNGLILEDGHKFFYVTNVSTGQAFRLPPCPPNHIWLDIGYDVASMTYKVGISLLDINSQLGYSIVTVGVDKPWRSVRIDHLSSLAGEMLSTCPVVIEGFLVWINFEGTKVVTLNLETEIMTEASPPFALLEKEKHIWPPSTVLLEEDEKVCCLSTGRYLTYFLRRSKFQWEVFEMKPKTAEWRKLFNICLEGQKDRIKMLGNCQGDEVDISLCGWLKYPDVLALRVRKHVCAMPLESMIFYNLVTCEIGADTCEISTSSSISDFFDVTLHKNSLVRLSEPF